MDNKLIINTIKIIYGIETDAELAVMMHQNPQSFNKMKFRSAYPFIPYELWK